MEKVEVLSTWPSPFGLRVLIALEEIGVKYEYQEEDPLTKKSDLLLQMNPVHKKIPVLIHNDQPYMLVSHMEKVKVLSTWPSPFGLRVLIALEEIGVKYEYQEEDLSNKSGLLLLMNPVQKKIPVLIHNDQPICESLIILQYIDEVWDSKQLLSSKPYDRALALFWADFADKKFFDSGFGIVKSKDEAQEQAKREMLENLQFLEGAFKEMPAGGSLPFFGGKDFGFLDIALAPYVSWFHIFETIGNFKIPFETEYPLLDAWGKRCMERESVKKILPSFDRLLERVFQARKRFVVD